MTDKILDHSSHWKSWVQYDSDRVACAKCSVVLYEGELPTNAKGILEVLDRDFLNYPVLATIEGQIPGMPTNRITPTDHPAFTVVEDSEVNETYYNDEDNYIDPNEESGPSPIETAKAIHPSTVKPNRYPTNENEVQQIAKENAIQSIPAPGSQVALKTTYSRTIKDNPNGQFGSITASFELTEVFPGEMQAEEIQKVAEAQYQVLKATVLAELELPFSQDETTKRIMETFPGSTVVASAPAEQAPRVAAQARQAAPPSNPPAVRQQARTAAPRGRSGAAPRPDVLWQELFDHPEEWFWNNPKQNANAPDYMSTKYFNDKGYPVGLWEVSQYTNASCPDPDYLNTMDAGAFAQERPQQRR